MTRALVLGGGGLVGVAWEVGVLTGLAQAGIDLSGPTVSGGSQPDTILGTSAGSMVGSLLSRYDLDTLAAMALDDESSSVAMESVPLLDFTLMQQCFTAWQDLPNDAAEALARVGAFATQFEGIGEDRYVASMADVVGSNWVDERFRCTAVDATSGKFVVWDHASQVALSRAVASSCSVPTIFPTVTITHAGGSGRFMDGGVRSGTSIDVVAGATSILVLAPIGSWAGDTLDASAAAAVDRETTLAQAAGSSVVTLYPDDVTNSATITSPLARMDPASRPAALEHGIRQGQALAGRMQFW